MTATYESIFTATSSSSTTITFTDIPSTYTDLVLVISGANSASSVKSIRFNNTSTNYQVTSVLGIGSSYLYGGQYNNESYLDASNAGSNPYVTVVHINNYASTNIKKRYLSKHGSGRTSVDIMIGGWDSTAAINRIDVIISGNNFGSSVFSLYGIKAE